MADQEEFKTKTLDEAIAELAYEQEQRSKDAELLRVCRALANADRSLLKRVRKAYRRWMEADRWRLLAIEEGRSEAGIRIRTERAANLRVELEREKAYHLERQKANAAYVREQATK